MPGEEGPCKRPHPTFPRSGMPLEENHRECSLLPQEAMGTNDSLGCKCPSGRGRQQTGLIAGDSQVPTGASGALPGPLSSAASSCSIPDCPPPYPGDPSSSRCSIGGSFQAHPGVLCGADWEGSTFTCSGPEATFQTGLQPSPPGGSSETSAA